MERSSVLLRRLWFVFAALLVLALVAACQAPVPAAPASESAAPAEDTGSAAEESSLPAAEGTFTYWGGLIFSEAANQMLVDRIEQWGEERGVDVDVVMINQNETVQRVSAAIEAGTMPDALDVGRSFMDLLALQGQLEPMDELYAEIGAEIGWLPAADLATNPDRVEGHRWGIPFSLGGNVLYRRADVLEPVGFTEAPDTWLELTEMARAANNPPEVYGMGFALSNVGDANTTTTTILQSFGGRIADDEGVNCTLDSPETRAYLEWITGAYAEGLFPPGVTTWDGAGDNVAYQSGNAAFIFNPGSVFLYMRDNDPELGDATRYSALPAGPVLRISPVDANVRVIPTSSNNKELARDLLKYLADPEFMKEYYYNAIYGPAAEAYQDAPIFTESPVHEGLLDLALNGTFGAYPDVDNPAFAEYNTNFLTPRMVQRVVVDGISIDEAIAETQEACQAIYDKYK
ncbi:MAG: extracellular solute-binding protein [Caldilineaceae bacterium]|nr:extracellular solute-binding protein [Caldilineaceae bacterium]